jgi:hypothetical protein
MTAEILRKLGVELEKGITSEIQIVYLLAGIRKLIERDKVEDQYRDLKFHCDWALHSSMDRAAAKAVLRQFDAAFVLLKGNEKWRDLPARLKSEIDRILQMRSFKNELTVFLKAYDLPPLERHRDDGWVYFLHLYTKVIEDIPLSISVPARRKATMHSDDKGDPKHVTRVTVNFEKALETFKDEHGEELLFKVTWTIYDKNGQAGSIFVVNSFSV